MSARDVGELAYLLRFGLYAHTAALEIARDPAASTSALTSGSAEGVVHCRDGSERPFDLRHVIELMRNEPALSDELDRAWCVSSLMLLGDSLSAENYFDRAPVLEMVRHLRNAVAHGNRFTLRNPKELRAWPAHMRDASCRTANPPEITQERDGDRVLFDFMAPGDVLDLLISVGTHLLSLHEAANSN
ncbi:MAG TPA: hypothetical protein VFK41_09040 [Nocardioidaceae bacterium]|nr:hypothetical protein [Nocardioidaceae bacterium]